MNLTNKHILIVEDDRFMTFLEQTILKQVLRNVPTSAAENGKQGIAFITRHNDKKNDLLIFLDINMPVMDGFEFLESIDKIPTHCNCTVIMISSSISKADKEKSFTYPAVKDFISKPLTAENLKKALPTDWHYLMKNN